MSKILHIFPDSLFVKGYLGLIKKDKINSHKFILTDIGSNTSFNDKKYSDYILGKVSTFKLFDFIKLRKLLKHIDYDKLIIHSGYFNYLVLAFLFNKKVLNKSVLSLWGGTDSKKFTVKKENKKYILFAYFYNKIRKRMYRKIKIIMSIIPDDFKSIKEEYNLNAKNYISIYPFEQLRTSKNKKQNINDYIKVQICHSGSVECNTIEVIDKLKKYKDEKILVYASLSYGNKKYIKKVIEYGKKCFGDKFIYMDKMVGFDKYNEYISSLNVLINNCEIQQGLGNLNLAFFNGVKVFLNNKGKNIKLYKKEGLNFYDINSVDKLNFKDFYKDSEELKKDNMKNKFILSFFDNDYSFDKWIVVFNEEL